MTAPLPRVSLVAGRGLSLHRADALVLPVILLLPELPVWVLSSSTATWTHLHSHPPLRMVPLKDFATAA